MSKDEKSYSADSRIAYDTETTRYSTEIKNEFGHSILTVSGTEKELVRIAAGAVVAALNKARG